MSLTLRERASKRLNGLKAARLPFEAEWKEIAQHAQPSRSKFLYGDNDRQFRRSNRAIYNSHGILAFRKLAAGMTSGLSSPSRPWFRLTSYNEDDLQSEEVREWLSDVEVRMYAFLAETNFYAAAKSGYAELGMFGTEACVMVEHPSEGAVCHPLTVGEYYIALGDNAKPDTLYRKAWMTVHQAVQSFGLDKVSTRVKDQYNRSDYEEIVRIWHAIEPNDERDIDLMTAKGKPWRSFYWDENDGDPVNGYLRVEGFNEQPFWAPRWDAIGGDTYGSSPGMEALPDLRELQLSTKRANLILAKMENPEKIVPSTLGRLTGQPGNVVSVASVDKDQVIVPYVPDPMALAKAEEKVARLEQKVDAISYADLFMAITNMEGIQPRNVEEIASRNEEKMTQLGPVIERVNGEKLQVAIDRTFGIMTRLGIIPPAPEQLQGKSLKIDFVSILTQMQRMVGLGQTERVTSFIGNLAAAFPEAADKLNVDEAIDDYADRAGSPPKIIRSDDEVEQLREARQQQKNAAAAAAAMPAVKDGADAARLLSEAAQNGGGVQNLVGGPGL
jgi:hypothetical protein